MREPLMYMFNPWLKLPYLIFKYRYRKFHMYFDDRLKRISKYSDYQIESNYPRIYIFIAKIFNIVLKKTPRMRWFEEFV
jgi:hypothetical protein